MTSHWEHKTLFWGFSGLFRKITIQYNRNIYCEQRHGSKVIQPFYSRSFLDCGPMGGENAFWAAWDVLGCSTSSGHWSKKPSPLLSLSFPPSIPLSLHSAGSQRSVVVLVAAGRPAAGRPSPAALPGSDLAEGPAQRHPQGPALHGPQHQAPVTNPEPPKLAAQLPVQQLVKQSVSQSVCLSVRSAAGALLPEDVQLHCCHFSGPLWAPSTQRSSLDSPPSPGIREELHLLPLIDTLTLSFWKEKKNKPSGKTVISNTNSCASVPLQLPLYVSYAGFNPHERKKKIQLQFRSYLTK